MSKSDYRSDTYDFVLFSKSFFTDTVMKEKVKDYWKISNWKIRGNDIEYDDGSMKMKFDIENLMIKKEVWRNRLVEYRRDILLLNFWKLYKVTRHTKIKLIQLQGKSRMVLTTVTDRVKYNEKVNALKKWEVPTDIKNLIVSYI